MTIAPPRHPYRPAAAQVYPRACGGTGGWRGSIGSSGGLSPRLRGNPPGHAGGVGSGRSIPALAGEPRVDGRPRAPAAVYPRACGGTFLDVIRHRADAGLSPRLRGNPHRDLGSTRGRRSIPALAGEPVGGAVRSGSSTVYPRACGGTVSATAETSRAVGLSPRLRGNLRSGDDRGHLRGSIPALAGEPGTGRRTPRPSRVYPRACGGTSKMAETPLSTRGLSPRLRGNRRRRTPAGGSSGSIPALAGEPSPTSGDRDAVRVYPRACGGTPRPRRQSARGAGLSPRLRGNRRESKGRPAVPDVPDVPVRNGDRVRPYRRAGNELGPPYPMYPIKVHLGILPACAGGRMCIERVHRVRSPEVVAAVDLCAVPDQCRIGYIGYIGDGQNGVGGG